MLKQRIIPSLLLKDGRIVKGKNFGIFHDAVARKNGSGRADLGHCARKGFKRTIQRDGSVLARIKILGVIR